MAETVKMCDMSAKIAAVVFQCLNYTKIQLKIDRCGNRSIITDVEPKNLTYPEGWYYAKGCFRNKHMSSTGMYEELPMYKTNGERWRDFARYCTLYD